MLSTWKFEDGQPRKLGEPGSPEAAPDLARLRTDVDALLHGLSICRDEVAALSEHLAALGIIEPSFLLGLFRRRLAPQKVPQAAEYSLPAASGAPAAASASRVPAQVIGARASGAVVPKTSAGRASGYEDEANAVAGCEAVPVASSADFSGAEVSAEFSDLLLFGGSVNALSCKFSGKSASDACVRFSLSRSTWEVMPRLPEPRVGAAAAALGGDVYICGGSRAADGPALSTVNRYVAGSSSWQAVPNMLRERLGAAAGALGGRLYVCGGASGQSWSNQETRVERSSELFCAEKQCWEPGPALLEPRANLAAGVVGGRLLVVGGRSGDLPTPLIRRSAEFLTLRRESKWNMAPPMRECRDSPAVAVMKHRLFVCGGFDGFRPSSSVECFDSERGVWESATLGMSVPRVGSQAIGLAGRILVFGGSSHNELLRTAECLQVSQWRVAAWTPLPALPEARASFALAAVQLERRF